MAARVVFSRLLSRTNKHVLANVKSSRTRHFAIHRNSFPHNCNSFSHGCIERSILGSSLLKNNSFSVSFVKLSSSSSGDSTLKYHDIPNLLKDTLKARGSDDKLYETQMEVLDKLVQYKSGTTTIDAVRSHISYLNPQQIYELAACIFGLTNTVGSVASEMAAPLFWMASVAGNTDAKYSYAKLLQLGEGVEPDPIEAGKMFKELSEKGHPFAQFSLAQMYYSGVGVDQDLKMALSLFEVSAENGILPSYTFLGNMYRTGQGVEEDKVQALEYYKEGERKGDMACILALAYCYGHGDGVSEDHEKAYQYHQIAADKGLPAAQYNVGVHYFAGKGVTLDMTKAAEWFQAAADQGFDLAQINLGNMYYNGLGVDKNLHKAVEWYRKAAMKNPNAKALLEEAESELNNTDNTKPS